jgi:hypothetical protein
MVALMRRLGLGVLFAVSTFLGCAHSSGASSRAIKPDVTTQVRLEAIRRAQVWSMTDVPSMDLMAGPDGPGSFAPNARVSCDYLEKALGGHSPKFVCVIPPDDELKVKFGRDNGEVYAEVAASRLFWALGFYAERMYPVRVDCRSCPSSIQGTEMSSIQRKLAGKDIETHDTLGWAWPDLDLVDPTAGGASRAQRDALKLLAVFIQHTDSKPEQQRLVCVDKREKGLENDPCPDAVMMVHDLGLTFGHANVFNRNRVGSVNLDEWSRARLWKDPAHCIGNLPKSSTGTLDNPIISEGGRKFLADLLVQLADVQLHDLFEAARFPRRSTASDSAIDRTTIAQWVDAFKQKRDEVVNVTCPQ